MTGLTITGWGTALPDRTLSNKELGAGLGVSETWIEQRTGIRSRRIAGDRDTTATLATQACADAIARAGVEASTIDLVIVATCTSEMQLPATASLVQARLGCTRAGAFDLNAGCAGFVYALAQAHGHLEAGTYERVLVCGADVLSRFTDYSDAQSCILFGDGAGAVVVERSASSPDLGSFVLASDGSAPELLCIPQGGLIQMRGREVFRRAVEEMSASLRQVLVGSGASLDDIDLIVFHQANARIVDAIAERMSLDPAKVVTNIATLGNTSAASIPLALADAAESNRLDPGAVIAVVAFGAGFAWAAGLVRWGTSAKVEPRPIAQLVEIA